MDLLEGRLAAAAVPVERLPEGLRVADPSRNLLMLTM